MPLRKRGTIIPLTACALAFGAATLPASASAWGLSGSTTTTTTAPSLESQIPVATADGCTTLPTKQSFSKFDDLAQYYVAPGGSFEKNTPAWKLSDGAKIVSGNENLGIHDGTRALELPVGATAASPEFCVDETNPTFRFTAKLSSGDGGYAAVVIYRDSAGEVTRAQFTSSSEGDYFNGLTNWNPSSVNALATHIPLVSGGATASVQLMFVGTTKAYGQWVAAKATIDSVMVDPYRRG